MEFIKRNTEYAIRSLVHLSLSQGEVVSAREIAEAQDVPLVFLHKILQKLTHAGLVSSHRGIQGGFSLAKKPVDINLLEVVTIMQGRPAMNRCFLGKDACERAPECKLKKNWLEMELKVADFLKGITFQNLADQISGKVESQDSDHL